MTFRIYRQLTLTGFTLNCDSYVKVNRKKSDDHNSNNDNNNNIKINIIIIIRS